MIFKMRLQGFVFRGEEVRAKASEGGIFENNNWSVFTRTVGPNRKGLICDAITFIKVALNETSAAVINKETDALRFIQDLGVQNFAVQQSAAERKNHITVTALAGSGRGSVLNDNYFRTLNEPASATGKAALLKNLDIWPETAYLPCINAFHFIMQQGILVNRRIKQK